jgi:hypothetical protein
MCEAQATTKEHAPPRSFFPEGYRRNLITVPSCDRHNSDNSLDVEYVRNVIATQHGVNNLAARVFEKAQRSWNRSPKLLSRTFREFRAVQYEGSETGAFHIDLPRHRTVMQAIAYAIYFTTRGKKHYGDWRIFTPSFKYAPAMLGGKPDPWESFRKMLASGTCQPLPMPEPQVFKCGEISNDQNQVIYRFEFYEAVVVNTWTLYRTHVTF